METCVTCASQTSWRRAENVTLALWPTAIRETSTSFICTVTFILERSAMVISAPAEPAPAPEPEPAPAPPGEPTDAPFTAFMTMIVPSHGAVTVRLSAWATASS